MPLVEKKQLMDSGSMTRVLRRLADEILERENGVKDLVFVGIHTGGVYLSQRLGKLIEGMEGKKVPQGAVDITLYRDDALEGLPRPVIGSTELPFALGAKKVVLVDDVLYTGRTIRAALDALNDFGRPQRVRLVVLVDRGCRELPIQADYVGLRVDTTPNQSVKVRLTERGGSDQVVLLELE
ncbi:MAG: bifunctional pyr operon transcriptional regulator/uracil phosphoribosyltransferase PyrR [Pseudomonadota bacterium]